MINLFHKNIFKKSWGAATLVLTTIMLVTSTMIVIFAANQGKMLESLTANQTRNKQAMQAALAGAEYGVNYLQQNSATIVANPVSGFISYTTGAITNVTLSNNSKYSITYTNPVANNYNLIKITATGVSDDSSATRVVSQLVQFGSMLSSPPTIPLVSKGNLTMSGNASLTNTSNTTTVQLGGTASLSGGANTILNSGTSSTSGNIQSDISQNNSSIADMSQADFFASYFGTQPDAVKNNVQNLYTNSTSTNYSTTLNGMTGTTIWIEQTGGTASISGSTVIGTAANPVLLIVNGNLNISGNVVINGFIFAIGPASATTTITGNVAITGGLVASDNFTMSGNTGIVYDPTVINNLQNSSSTKYYAKVTGGWKDF
jgi:hypothetical protein